MPPFRYDAPENRSANSIAALMLRPGEIEAQKATAIGNAQAQAAQASGQAWAGAAQNIGQTIQQATDPKRQSEALALKEQKTAIAEHDTFKKILKDTPPLNENGMQLYNLPALASKATAAGIDPSGYLEHYANVNTGFRNEYQARLATVQAGAQGLMLAPDPTLAHDFLDRLAANNTITSQVHQHLSSMINADPSPANITRIAQPFAGKLTPVMGKPGETPLNPITAQPMGASLPEKPEVVPAGGTLVQPPAPGAAPDAKPNVLFTAPTAPTETSLDAAAQALLAKKALGQPLTPEEAANLKGYQDRKRTVSDPAMLAAMDRQERTIHAQIASQDRAQRFTEHQAGQKELTDKVEAPYLDTVAKLNSLRDVVDAAKAGNMVAGSVQSLQGILAVVTSEGVKRINDTELHQVQGAGNLLERVKGYVRGLKDGDPLSPKMQDDLRALADVLQKGAQKKYEDGFTQVTKRYGLSDEKPVTQSSAPPTGGNTDPLGLFK